MDRPGHLTAPDGDRPPAALTTPRLRLRPAAPSDAPLLRRLWEERDPRVPAHRRIDAAGRPTTADLEAWLGDAAPAFGLGLLVVERRGDGAALGYCGLVENPAVPAGEPELAYEFLEEHHGRGYATEAGAAVIDRARAAGFERLWATIRDWNAASLRVAEKLGFAASGRVDEDPVHGGSIHLVSRPAR